MFITAGAILAERAACARVERSKIEEILRRGLDQAAALRGAREFAPADPAARAFIAHGWRRSRLASESGQRAARAKVPC